MKTVWRVRLVLAAFASLVLAGADPALATNPTQTAVTAPTEPLFILRDFDAPTPLHVQGITTGGSSPDSVTIKCVPHSGTPETFGTLPMNGSGAFSGDVGVTTDRRYACVVEALPAGEAIGARPGAANPSFTGPRAYIGSKDVQQTGGASSPITLVEVVTQKVQGSWDHDQTGSCTVNRALLIDPVTFEESDSPFVCNAWLGGSDEGVANPGTRSQLIVDDANAYLRGSAAFINQNAAHQPKLVTQFQHDPTNGDLTMNATEEASKCTVDTSFPPDSTKCPDFVSTGVQVETFITDVGPGTTSQVVQKFTSTDGGEHRLDLLWDNETEHNAHNGGIRFPWVDDTYKPRAEGDTVTPPPPGPGSVMVKPNVSFADGTLAGVQGAMTWAAAPESVKFIRPTGGPGFISDFELGYHRTVTPSAPVWFAWSLNMGTASEGLLSVAHDAESAFKPRVAITAPADGSSTQSGTVTVTGTSSDASGDPVAVSLNGSAAPVATDGSWSLDVPLALGPNTLTATATNRYGNTAQATSAVTLAPVTGPPPPTHVFRGARFTGRTTLTLDRHGRVVIRVACPADSQDECVGKLALQSAGPVAARRKAKRIKLGSHRFRAKAGKTAKVRVKISRKGRKPIAKRGRLAARLTVTSADGSGQQKVTKRRLTLRAAPRKSR